MKSGHLAIVAFALWAASSIAQTAQYDFYAAGVYPGAAATTPLAIGRRQIVGYYQVPNALHAYIQTGKSFVTAEPKGSRTAYLSGVNSHGVAVGGFCPLGCNPRTGTHGYTYNIRTGKIHTFDFPLQGASTAAYGINDAGVIVGGYCPNSPVCPQGAFNPTTHGFVDDHGAFTTLDFPNAQATNPRAINDDGVIVGFYLINNTGPHAFVYEDGKFTNIDPPGAGDAEAEAVNNHGEVAGWFNDATGSHGFIYRRGKFTQIDRPKTSATTVLGINDCGDLVGVWSPPIGFPIPFKAIPEKGPTSAEQP